LLYYRINTNKASRKNYDIRLKVFYL